MFVAGEEMLHGLGDGELHEHLAAERQHHDEERKPATGIAHRDGSVGTPVDLRALAGSEVQLERVGWYREVTVKGLDCQAVPALLVARAQIVSQITTLKNCVRGLLKTFGNCPGWAGSVWVRRIDSMGG